MRIRPTKYASFSYWLWFIGFGGLALVLANLPLFNLLAFEFCAVLALCISFAGAHVTLTVIHETKRRPDALQGPPHRVVLQCFGQGLLLNAGLLGLPLGIILLNAFRVENCNFTEGFLFFLLLPVISGLYATAAGVFFGTWIQKRWLAFLLYLLYLLLSCIPVVLNLIVHPPVFAYHATFGYFPGPIYDFVVPITETLLIARAETLLWTLLFLGTAVIGCEVSRDTNLMPHLRWRRVFRPLTSRLWLLLFVAGVCGFQFYAGALGIRPTRTDIARALGGYRETEHFEIFYARELAADIEVIAQDCEFQYAELADYLKPEGGALSQKVRAYLYASPEQKKRLIGARETSVEDPFGHGFHIHAQGFPHPVLKHELAHVFTVPWSPLKVSLKIGLHEGIAVAADWSEGRLTGHQWAKSMHRLEIAPPLSSILGIGFWGHAGSRSYLLAGSFVRFLVDTYGIEKFKGVFPTGDFVKHYAKEVSALEAEWLDFLERVPLTDADTAYATHRLQRGSVFEQVCAHEMAARRTTAWRAYYRNDFLTAAETFRSMLTVEPDTLSTMRGLMFAAYRMRAYDEALSFATAIADAADTRYSAEALLLEADIYWLKGEHEQARRKYTAVETAYQTIDHRRIKRIAALGYPGTESEDRSVRELLRGVLVEPKESGEKMAYLSICMQRDPDGWLAPLLAGELLHREQAWWSSTRYLQQAIPRLESAGQLTPEQRGSLIVGARRMVGINAYHERDYAHGADVFSRIAADGAVPLGTVLEAEAWLRRCRWLKNWE